MEGGQFAQDEIAPEQIQARYDELSEHILMPERRLISTLVVETREEAEQHRADILAHVDERHETVREIFLRYVLNHSIDEATRDNDGGIGFIAHPDDGGTANRALADAAFGVEEAGLLAEPVRTGRGWELVLVRAIMEPIEPSAEEMETLLREMIVSERRARAIRAEFDAMRAQVPVSMDAAAIASLQAHYVAAGGATEIARPRRFSVDGLYDSPERVLGQEFVENNVLRDGVLSVPFAEVAEAPQPVEEGSGEAAEGTTAVELQALDPAPPHCRRPIRGNRVNRWIAILLVALSVSSVGQIVRPAVAQAEILDRIVARVGDDIITLTDVARTIPIYLQVVAVDPARRATSESRRELANEIVQYMIDTQLMVADAESRDLAITDTELDEFLARQQASTGMTPAQFEAELASAQISFDDFREFYRGELNRVRLMQIDVVARVTVTDEEIAAAISERYPDGYAEIIITTSHILVPLAPDATPDEESAALTRITLLRDQIIGGRPFEEIASGVNPDATRATGGRLGAFSTDELVPEFSRAALNLEVGEISEPVLTQFGLHLIRLDAIERTEREPPADLEERIRFELRQSEASRQEAIYLRRLRDGAFVEVLFTEFDV